MFCPLCGAKVTEGSAFCDSCGNKITENQPEPVVTPTPEQPIVQEVEAQPPMPTNPAEPKFRKSKYIRNLGSKKVKALSKIVWAVFLAVVIVLGLGTYNIVGAGIEEIPVVTMIAPEDDMQELLKYKDDAIELLDKADEALNDVKSELSNEEYNILKGFLDETKTFVQTPSIANAKNIMSRFEEVSETVGKYTDNEDIKDIKEQIDSVDFIEEFSEPMKYIDIGTYILFGFAGFIALLLLLATALKSNGLTIFCMILSAPILYFIAGQIYCVIAAVLFISLIVMFSIINVEYKNYRKSL